MRRSMLAMIEAGDAKEPHLEGSRICEIT